jgi:hypothetical protein
MTATFTNLKKALGPSRGALRQRLGEKPDPSRFFTSSNLRLPGKRH